jgi:hypothetical protein
MPVVIPTKAGIQKSAHGALVWIPAFAGMTKLRGRSSIFSTAPKALFSRIFPEEGKITSLSRNELQ